MDFDISKIWGINSESSFNQVALEVFEYQYSNNAIYRKFCDLLKRDISRITHYKQIPFLPISFFKTSNIIVKEKLPEATFLSSGTTNSVTSRHLVSDLSVYQESFLQAFKQFYGHPESYHILALLPSYLERKGSSLVYMIDHLIQLTGSNHSGFYLNNLKALSDKIKLLEKEKCKTILVGVSYALLDLLELENFKLKHTIVMETGGMKGRRKEMVKAELHETLKRGFGVQEIHSEYGMTELLSQAYSKQNGKFKTPPWMKVLTRDPEDALSILNNQKTGGINVIDLANINSCAFIATQDLGRIDTDGSFEIMGRFDHSDIRGCNLMVF